MPNPTDHTKCKSYRDSETICSDGFIQRPACRGSIGCMSCGAINEKYLPYCLSENLPKHWIDDAGRPVFYRSI